MKTGFIATQRPMLPCVADAHKKLVTTNRERAVKFAVRAFDVELPEDAKASIRQFLEGSVDSLRLYLRGSYDVDGTAYSYSMLKAVVDIVDIEE